MSDTIFTEGIEQHWIREKGNPASRLVYIGELMEVQR